MSFFSTTIAYFALFICWPRWPARYGAIVKIPSPLTTAEHISPCLSCTTIDQQYAPRHHFSTSGFRGCPMYPVYGHPPPDRRQGWTVQNWPLSCLVVVHV